jgi:hypothetical protein
MLLTTSPETLRKFAEITMHALVRTVFARLRQLDPAEEEKNLKQADEESPQQGEIRMNVPITSSELDVKIPDGGETNEESAVESLDAKTPTRASYSEVTTLQGKRTQCELPSTEFESLFNHLPFSQSPSHLY